MSQAKIPLDQDQDYWDEPQESPVQTDPSVCSTTEVILSEAVEPTATELPSPETSELTQLVQALQERNTFLLERVEQLESALNDCQSRLQSQNLTVIQEHIARLTHELASSHDIAQRQQQLIETITNHLRQNQEQVVLLEQECDLLRQQHREQSQVLHQSESTCLDLRTRLDRQQRFTLQLKAALERCLEKLDAQSGKSDKGEARVDAESSTAAETGSVQPSLFDETAFSQEAPVETLLNSKTLNSKTEPTEGNSPTPPKSVPIQTPITHKPLQAPEVVPIISQTLPPISSPPPIEAEPELVASHTSTSTNESELSSPSPIVYPARSSQKKLKSFAAVNLPTFPRRAEG